MEAFTDTHTHSVETALKAQDRPVDLRRMTNPRSILSNYLSKTHFLQNVHLPAAEPPKKSFLYMKNAKCGCTTILSTLMVHIQAVLGVSTEEPNFTAVHNPPKSLLRAGRKGLDVEEALDAITDDAHYKFTFVRDPISRTLSAYADKVLSPGRIRNDLLKHLQRPLDARITPSEFLDILANDEVARNLDRHWRPQRKEISFDFISYDFIGLTPNIRDELPFVINETFGVKTILNDTRKSLGHLTNSRDLVKDLSRRDLANLEAAFESDFEMIEAIEKRRESHSALLSK